MPELTPEQKAQLDKNIRAMLEQGAGEDDVVAYANDFRAKFDNVKKKEPSGLGSLFGKLSGSGGPSTSKKKNEPTIFDKPFLDRDIERSFNNSLSNPDLHKPKDGSLLRNEYYQKRKQEFETKKAATTFEVKSNPEALKAYNQKRHQEIDEQISLAEQKKELYRDHTNQESTGTFDITNPEKYKELEDEQNRLQQYKDELKSNIAYEAANQIIPKYLDSPVDFNPQEIGKEILRIADPQAAEEIDMVEQAGNVLPGIKRAELNRDGLNKAKEALQNHRFHPNYSSLIQNVEQQLQEFDETNYELTGNRIRENIGNILRSEGKQAWLGFGYDTETLKEAFQKTNPTPAEQKVFESYVLPLEQRVVGTQIPTGGFTKSLVNAMEKGGMSTVNTVRSFVGDRSDADRLVEIMGDSEQRFRPAQDRTRWQKIVDGTGDLTGQVLNMALISKGIGGVSKAFANPNVNLFLTSYLNSYDSYRKNALQVMPNASEAERNVYANFMAGVEGLTEKIFNDQKILKAFSKEVAPSVADITKKFVSKEITKEVAQNQLASSLKTFGREFLKSSGQNAVEEASVEVFDDIAQSVLGDKEFDLIATGKKAIETGFTTMLHGGLVSGLAARGAQRTEKSQRAFQKATIVDMAKNPAPYLASVEDLTLKGEITPEQAQEKTAIINAAGEYLKTLPEDVKLDAPEIASYITHKLNGDERSEAIADGILMGGIKVTDDIEDTTDNRAAAKALDIKYEPQEKIALTENQIALKEAVESGEVKGMNADFAKTALEDPAKTDDFLKEVASQALNKVQPDLSSDEKAMEGAKALYGEELVKLATSLYPKETPTPIGEEVALMDGEQLRELQVSAKAKQKERLIEAVGKEWYDKYAFASSEEKSKMEDALTDEQKKIFGGAGLPDAENPEVIKDLRQKVVAIETADDKETLASRIRQAVTDLSNGRNKTESVAILNAAGKRAQELGFDKKEMQDAAIADLRERVGDEDAKSILEKYFTPQKSSTPTPIGEEVGEVVGKPLAFKDNLKAKGFDVKSDGIVEKNGVRFTIENDKVYEVNNGEPSKYYATKTENVAIIENIENISADKGAASKALDEIIQSANEAGKELQLFARPPKGGKLTKQQLIDWYKRKGFVEREDGVMIKKPGQIKLNQGTENDVPSSSNVASSVASHTSGVGNSVGNADWSKDEPSTATALEDVYYAADNRNDAKVKQLEIIELIPREKIDEIFNETIGEGWKEGLKKGLVKESDIESLKSSHLKNQREQIIAKAYHKAKEDGSNPELVKAVEGLLNQGTTPERSVATEAQSENQKPETKTTTNEQPITSGSDRVIEDSATGTTTGDNAGLQMDNTSGGEGAGAPPSGEVVDVFSQRPATELSYRGLQNVANEFSLDDVKPRETKTDIQLRRDAEVTIDKWAKAGRYAENIEKLTQQAERKGILTDEERVIMEQHLSNVIGEARLLDKNSKEYDNKLLEIRRLKDAGETTRAAAGAALRIPTNSGSFPTTVEDAMVDRMRAAGVEELTTEQKKDVEEKFTEYERKQKEAEDKLAALEEKNQQLQAELEVARLKKETKKSTKKDFKKEREEIRKNISEKLKKSRSQANDVVRATVDFISIAPDVTKLMKSYLEEGITVLGEIVDKVHDDLKGVADIEKKDIVEILAGKYDTQETKYDLLTRLKTIKDKNSAEAIRIKAKLESGDFSKKPKYKSIFDNPELKEKYPQEYKSTLDAIVAKENAKHELALANLKEEMKKRTPWQKRVGIAAKVLRTAKALKAGIDFSATLVQNLLAVMAHPIVGAKGTIEAFRDMFSAQRFERELARLHSSEWWPLIEQSGLSVLDPKSLRESEKSDIYNDTFFDDMKINGRSIAPTKPFERHFTSLGNYIRVNLFLRKAQELLDEKKTFDTHPEQFKSIASIINNMTGRGTMTEKLEKHNDILSAFLWSPRLLASTMNVLGISDAALALKGQKGFYRNLTKEQRAYVVAEISRGIATGVLVMAAIGMAGDGDPDLDPLSPTFGTIKIGDYRYTLFGRFNSVVRDLFMVIAGKKHTEKGEDDLTDNRGNDIEDKMVQFFRGKANPTLGIAWNLITRKDFAGKPITVKGELKNALMPMSVDEIVTGINQDKLAGALIRGLPSMFGAKVTNEKDFEKAPKQTFTIYQKYGSKKRVASQEEYRKYLELKEAEFQKDYKAIKDRGYVWVNKYGELTTDRDAKKGIRKIETLTEDEIKDLEQRLKTSAAAQVKKEFKY